MEEISSPRKIGFIWLLLSPVLFAMAAISTVESLNTYYIQLVSFGAVSFLGFVSGLGLILKQSWAVKLCFVTSSIVCIYFVGAAVVMFFYMIPALFNTGVKALIIIPISIFSGLFGVPFFLMAKKLKGFSNGV